MVSERELVGLLHRADWTKLTLSGTVTGPERVVDTVIVVQSDEPPGGPWRRDGDDAEDEDEDGGPLPPPLRSVLGQLPPWVSERAQEQAWKARPGEPSGPFWNFEPTDQGAGCTLSVEPGRRFRADGADGTWALGCDGERMWHWLRDRQVRATLQLGFSRSDDRPRPPYRTLLAPSWLLTGYSLVLDGEETVCGRAGVRVHGTPRKIAEPGNRSGWSLGRSAGGGLFTPSPRWLGTEYSNEVDVVVDAELGILLRYSERSGDEPPSVTEFSSLDVGGPTGTARFSAPAGSFFGGDKGPRPGGASLGDALGETLETAGKEAVRTVAGLAAGGLGALIRYRSSRRRVDPFTRATAEAATPEAAMPTDEQPPAEPTDRSAPPPDDEALPDEVLHLLYRSGLGAPALRARLYQWGAFGSAILAAAVAAVPPAARGKGFGGVGFLVDTVNDVTREALTGDNHAVSSVAMDGWNEYRIDVERSVWDAGVFPHNVWDRKLAQTIASDGERQWQVYSDRVVTGPASPPPGDLADLVDPAWLLDGDVELSGGTEVWVDGRRAHRVVARYRDVAGRGMGWWQGIIFPVVAVVDAETGLLLRLTRFRGGRPTARQELRDVAPLEAGADFGFTPPAGLPVEDAESPREDDGPGPSNWSWRPPR